MCLLRARTLAPAAAASFSPFVSTKENNKKTEEGRGSNQIETISRRKESKITKGKTAKKSGTHYDYDYYYYRANSL